MSLRPHFRLPAHSQPRGDLCNQRRWRGRSGGSALQGGGCWGWGRLALPPAQGSPGTRQAATGGELATKAYSSGLKKKESENQSNFLLLDAGGCFPLGGCSRYLADKGPIQRLNYGPKPSV